MKYIILALFAGLLATACHKNSAQPGSGHQGNTPNFTAIQHYLKDSLSRASYDSLDFTGVVIATTDSGRTYFVTVPSRGIPVNQQSILLRVSASFQPIKAVRIFINQLPVPTGTVQTVFSFNGSIRKTYLSGSLIYASGINSGFITQLHNKVTDTEEADEPYQELPEIVIYAPGDSYYVDWDYILDDGGGGSYSYSSSTATSTSGGGGGAGAAPGGQAANANSFNVANELQATNPRITLKAFLNCFATVPDQGAKYSASLLVSIPNANNPSQLWNPLTGRVGHTFIQLTKSNGSNTVTQYVGFYADCGVCALSGDPVASKMVDNSGHPYNASLTLNLDADQFSILTQAMEYYSQNDYAMCNYNCTGFAVDAFNSVMQPGLSPTNLTIPGGTPGDMPNSLYILMQNTPNGTAGADISFFPTPQTAGNSHGACN
jgi:hypothetical protein